MRPQWNLQLCADHGLFSFLVGVLVGILQAMGCVAVLLLLLFMIA
jgi:hypothetical protein